MISIGRARFQIGYGQSLLIAVDQGHARGKGTGLVGLMQERDAKSSVSGADPTDQILLHVGDLVFVRADEEFTVLRISRPHPTSRTNPRSLVFGHLLEETPDELYVYDTISHDETKVQFSKLLRSGAGLFTVDQRTVELCLMDGGLSIRFSEELLTHVCACIDEEHVHPEQKNVSSEDEDSTDEEVAKEHDLGHESVPA